MDTIYRRLADYHLTVHCPRCDHETRHKVMPLLQHKKAVCPHCANLIDVNTALLEQKISAAQQRRDAQRDAKAGPQAAASPA